MIDKLPVIRGAIAAKLEVYGVDDISEKLPSPADERTTEWWSKVSPVLLN